ncbi:hypothetical protein ACTFIU_007112 [Dictyostelium citrinum]
MLLNKSLLILVAFVFAIVSATTYTEFKITGQNPITKKECDPSIIYTAQNGACQNVCGMYGKLIATSNSSQFNIEMSAVAGCSSSLGNTTLNCLPDEQAVQITPEISVICIAEKDSSSDSSATTIIASISAIIISLLFALL